MSVPGHARSWLPPAALPIREAMLRIRLPGQDLLQRA